MLEVVKENDVNGLLEKIKNGSDVNEIIEKKSLLMWAVVLNNYDVAKLLLINGADTKIKFNDEKSLLELSLICGDYDMFYLIFNFMSEKEIKENKKNICEFIKRVDFFKCIINKEKSTNKYTLEYKENNNSKFDMYKLKPKCSNKTKYNFRKLIQYINIDEVYDNVTNDTLVTYSIKNRKYTLIELLIENNCNINIKDIELAINIENFSETVLMMMVYQYGSVIELHDFTYSKDILEKVKLFEKNSLKVHVDIKDKKIIEEYLNLIKKDEINKFIDLIKHVDFKENNNFLEFINDCKIYANKNNSSKILDFLNSEMVLNMENTFNKQNILKEFNIPLEEEINYLSSTDIIKLIKNEDFDELREHVRNKKISDTLNVDFKYQLKDGFLEKLLKYNITGKNKFDYENLNGFFDILIEEYEELINYELISNNLNIRNSYWINKYLFNRKSMLSLVDSKKLITDCNIDIINAYDNVIDKSDLANIILSLYSNFNYEFKEKFNDIICRYFDLCCYLRKNGDLDNLDIIIANKNKSNEINKQRNNKKIKSL